MSMARTAASGRNRDLASFWPSPRRRGIAPGDTVMVGDSLHDMHAARAAGMVAVAVLTGPARAETLAPAADVVLPDIGHLPSWLAERAG